MKSEKKRRRRLIILLIILAALIGILIWQYVDNHREDWMTRDEALHIALRDAGTREGMIFDLHVDLERDGSLYYKIRFSDHTGIYSYSVDAHTGKILNKSFAES